MNEWLLVVVVVMYCVLFPFISFGKFHACFVCDPFKNAVSEKAESGFLNI